MCCTAMCLGNGFDLVENPAIESVAALRAQLWDAGFRPVPVLSAGKAPSGNDWGNVARQDPPGCLAFTPVPHALNTGVLCDGLRAIDIDVDDPEIASRCRSLVVQRFGEAPIRMRRNSPRCLVLYRAATGTPSKIVLAGRLGKIEVLGKGQQFVAFGRHPTGAELEWFPEPPGEESLSNLPPVDEDALLELLEQIAPIIDATPPPRTNGHDHASGDPQADPLRIAAALNAITNTGPADWEAWNRIGMAVWRATGASEIGWQAFNAWSARNASYDPAETRKRWEHYETSPPTSIGAGTLFHMARRVEEAPPELGPPPDDTNDPGYLASLEEDDRFHSTQHDAAEAATRHDTRAEPILPFPATGVTQAELDALTPREWVYGHFLIRRFISAIGAPGGAGKTAYAYAVALAIMAGAEILGETVHDPGNVWIYNLEDPRNELLKRLKAALLGHGIDFSEIADRIFLDSGRDRPLVIARAERDGTVVAWPHVPALIDELKARKIRLLIVDPFVRSHRVEENVNDHIDFVAALWAEVADKADCAVLLVHHFKKGGQSGDAGAFRGASALIDASRAAVTIATMSQDEAKKFDIPDDDRWQYVRVDNAKLNLAPPPGSAVWLKLTGIDIENAANGRPSDQVQTVTRWSVPSPWSEFSMAAVVRVLEKLQTGPEDGEQYTLTRGGKSTRWAGAVLVELGHKSEPEAIKILRAWVVSGLVESGRYISPKQRKERDGLIVNPAKLAELRNQPHAAPWPDDVT